MLPANIADLMAATRASHANAINLTITTIDTIITGDTDPDRWQAQVRNVHNTRTGPLASTVLLLTGFLGAAAVDLAWQTGRAPADIVDHWWEQAARAVDLAEANLNGETL